jgi:hypothetical protein
MERVPKKQIADETGPGFGLREALSAAIDGFRSVSDVGLIDLVLRENPAGSYAPERSGLYSWSAGIGS